MLKLVVDLSQMLIALMAVVGVVLGYGQLQAISGQLEQGNEHLRWQNFKELNLRYSDLYRAMPIVVNKLNGESSIFVSPEEGLHWSRQYFDLCLEEHQLHQNSLLPKDVWSVNISSGILNNFKQHPGIFNAYMRLKLNGVYNGFPQFLREIDGLATKGGFDVVSPAIKE
ncbi:MAG: hypothetical protein Q8O79_00310 [Pseudomonadota bacterium]|nr:hypothetical protein [Pseudomonadota bacterium]